jgi:DNA-directed RNA polymerase specialized sigma24 family protein
MAQAIEGAMDRQLRGLMNGAPRAGTLDTAIANHRRRQRRRAELEAKAAPLMAVDVDPWPEVDDRLDLERRLARLDGATRVLVVDFVAGHTYAELAAAQRCPVGTVKAQIHRARLKLAA